jgi:multidrug resistance efflux pump
MMYDEKRRTIVLVVGLSLSLLLSACQATASEQTPTPDSELGSTFIPIISATGKILPQQWALMSMPVSGVIEEINIEEGDSAKKGDVILRLNGTDQLQALVKNAEVSYLSAEKNLHDFYDQQEITLAEVQMAVAKAQTEMDDAADNRGRKEYRRSSDNTLDGLRADVVVAEQALKDAEEYYSYFENHKGADDPDRARALSALVAVRKAKDKAVYNLNYALSYPDAEEVAEADARIMIAEANLAYSQAELAKLQDGPDAEMEAILKAQVENTKAQWAAAQDDLADLALKAPFKGTVGKIYYRVNEWVTPGSALVMFGNLDSFIIETTDLSEIDVAQIRIGAPAKVSFDALPDLISTAKVVYISPKSEEGSGVNYLVKLELDEIPAGVKWGMTAFVDIEIAED